MPEGDTVWRAARRLHAGLAGHELTRTDFRVPQHATLDFSGEVLHDVVSRGKHLLMHVADHTIRTHLAMEGRWHVHPVGTRWRRPGHAARLVLRTATTEAVGFWLAAVDVVPTVREHELVGHLGPDLLGPDWDLDEAVRRVTAQPERPIFVALLDQRNLAGLGNEYVNELLFLTGLAPERLVGDVPDVRRVCELGHRLITANRDRLGRTFTSDTRPGRQTWVYGRERQRCRRCGSPIEQGSLGDRPTHERDTYRCPTCQPG